MIKKILIFARKSIKLTILIAISIFIIVSAVVLFFKPIYSVTINGEVVGYIKNKSKFQSKINSYIEKGDETKQNVAFVQVDYSPEYALCLLKRGIETNEDEIFTSIQEKGVTYYRYYSILEDGTEKIYVPDFQTAEEIVNKLKEKDSSNIDKISIIELYETELKDFTPVEDAVNSLYVQKIIEVAVKPKAKKTSSGSVNTSMNISYKKVELGIELIHPIQGQITSRFGARSSIRSSDHTGLDIAAPNGTAIKAAAAGTVTFSGYKGSYGYMIVITHENGVETYYAHCSKLYASVGQYVKQGEKIAAVGTSGNSTGYHLHLEVRVNGIAYNPQNYLY